MHQAELTTEYQIRRILRTNTVVGPNTIILTSADDDTPLLRTRALTFSMHTIDPIQLCWLRWGKCDGRPFGDCTVLQEWNHG